MPITVQCSCGKRMGLSDALAGKTIKCPACGDPLTVTGMAAPASARKPAKKESASPAIYISKGKIILLATLACLGIICLVTYLGPVRARSQWEDIGGKADDDVTNVVSFGLQAYLSEQGEYDPSRSGGGQPAVDGHVAFFWPYLVMSMPERIRFFGKTTQGDFKGYYYTKTGEIEADVAYGGMTFAGMVNLAKATGQFHMTGRVANGFPQAEVNGTPIKIVWPGKDQ
jgi:hypothetical protein